MAKYEPCTITLTFKLLITKVRFSQVIFELIVFLDGQTAMA